MPSRTAAHLTSSGFPSVTVGSLFTSLLCWNSPGILASISSWFRLSFWGSMHFSNFLRKYVRQVNILRPCVSQNGFILLSHFNEKFETLSENTLCTILKLFLTAVLLWGESPMLFRPLWLSMFLSLIPTPHQDAFRIFLYNQCSEILWFATKIFLLH